MTRVSRSARIVALLLAAQVAAVLLYVYVEGRRQGPRFGPFSFERIDPPPELPSVELQHIDGRASSTRELRGRPVLLHFWATWCPPCRDELPGLLELAARQPELALLALAVDDDWQTLQRFFGGAVPAPVVQEASRTLVRHFAVGELPETYLFDRDGRALLRFAGPRDWRSPAARDALAPFLGRSAAQSPGPDPAPSALPTRQDLFLSSRGRVRQGSALSDGQGAEVSRGGARLRPGPNLTLEPPPTAANGPVGEPRLWVAAVRGVGRQRGGPAVSGLRPLY